MGRWIAFIVAGSVLVGLLAGKAWGPAAGLAAGVLTLVLGSVALTLYRNQRDLEELERGEVPDAVERALPDDRDE